MKLENAGLISKTEAAKRMLSGEVFYSSEGHKLYARINKKIQFVVEFSGGSVQEINGLWDSVVKWQKEIQWECALNTNEVLCWIGNALPKSAGCAVMIRGFDPTRDMPYQDNSGTWWKYATPVTREETL